MGIWDDQITDLEAVGMRFSDAELRALESPAEGLKVLHLQPLWDPETPEGQVWYVEDPTDEANQPGLRRPFYVPEILLLWDPTDTQRYDPSKRLIEDMDTNYGILSEGFPFYIATLDWDHEPVSNGMTTYRSDEPLPYPWHTCLVLETAFEEEAAERLVEYATNMLAKSIYPQLDFLNDVERSSDFAVDILGVWADTKGAYEGPPEGLEMSYEQLTADFTDPEDIIKSIVGGVDDLISAGYLPDPRWDEERTKQWAQTPMDIGPLELFIPDTDFMARDLYASLTRRMRHFQRRWNRVGGHNARQVLLQREGIF